MSDRPHLTEAIRLMRRCGGLDDVSDEKIAATTATHVIEVRLALDEVKTSIVGTGPGRRACAALLRLATLLGRVPRLR